MLKLGPEKKKTPSQEHFPDNASLTSLRTSRLFNVLQCSITSIEEQSFLAETDCVEYIKNDGINLTVYSLCYQQCT